MDFKDKSESETSVTRPTSVKITREVMSRNKCLSPGAMTRNLHKGGADRCGGI